MRTLLLVTAAFAATALGPATATNAAAPAYSKAQLAVMVLPTQQVGPGLVVALGSGPTNNAAGADETLDPKDTGAQLARTGRIAGYSLNYDEPSYASLERGRGLISIGSSVELFTTPAAAEAFVAKRVRDSVRFRGKGIGGGLHVTESETFPAPGVGSNPIGVRETIRLGDKSFYTTGVAFRAGTLVAGVSITRADSEFEFERAIHLARLLAKRIRLVGSGKLGARPVAVPQTGRNGRPPRGGPDLAPLALSASDLPNGATVAGEEYVANNRSIGSYKREFSFLAAPSGASTLDSVASVVTLLREPAEAAAFLLVFRAFYFSQDIVAQFQAQGLQAVTIEQRTPLRVGDEAFALVLHTTAGGEATRVAQVFLRSGKTLGVLTITGSASAFKASAVEPLAAKFAARLKKG